MRVHRNAQRFIRLRPRLLIPLSEIYPAVLKLPLLVDLFTTKTSNEKIRIKFHYERGLNYNARRLLKYISHFTLDGLIKPQN
jgi:hypothetical protein